MYFRVSSTSKSSYYISTLLTMHGSQLFLANSIIFAALCPSSNERVGNCRNLLANMLNRDAMLSQYICMHIHTGMVTLWCSTARLYIVMVVYSYGQVRTTTVSSQELLAVTVKLASRRSVMPLLCKAV